MTDWPTIMIGIAILGGLMAYCIAERKGKNDRKNRS